MKLFILAILLFLINTKCDILTFENKPYKPNIAHKIHKFNFIEGKNKTISRIFLCFYMKNS